MIRQIPKTKGRSLRGRQVAEYLRGRSDDNAGIDEDGGDDRQVDMHRGSGGDDPSNGADRPNSGNELSETGAEG